MLTEWDLLSSKHFGIGDVILGHDEVVVSGHRIFVGEHNKLVILCIVQATMATLRKSQGQHASLVLHRQGRLQPRVIWPALTILVEKEIGEMCFRRKCG